MLAPWVSEATGRRTSFAGAGGISHLYHEAFDVAMYQSIVVVPACTKSQEVIRCFLHILAVDFDLDVAQVGM